MEPVVDKRVKLIVRLSELTKSRKLEWISNDRAKVYAIVGDVIVFLSSVDDEIPLERIVITSLDESQRLDSFSDEDLLSSDIAPEEGIYSMMLATRKLAMRQASKVDDTLDGLLSELGKLN